MTTRIETSSFTREGKKYIITLSATGSPSCSCAGWLFGTGRNERGFCKHMEMEAPMIEALTQRAEAEPETATSMWEKRWCPKCEEVRDVLRLGARCLQCGTKTVERHKDQRKE